MGSLWLNEAGEDPFSWSLTAHCHQNKIRGIGMKNKESLLGKTGSVCHSSLGSAWTPGGLKNSALEGYVAFCRKDEGCPQIFKSLRYRLLIHWKLLKCRNKQRADLLSWAGKQHFLSLLFLVCKRGLSQDFLQGYVRRILKVNGKHLEWFLVCGKP